MPVAEGAKRVRGTGPCPARIAIYGTAPSKNDQWRGVPFSWKDGIVLDSFSTWHGLHPHHKYWTGNVVQFFPGKDRQGKDLKPDGADIERDEPVIMRELALVRPEIVIALGPVAAAWFLPGNSQEMSTLNGIPHLSTKKGLEHVIVFPVVHPIEGLFAPKQAAETWLGLRAVARFLKKDPLAPTLFESITPSAKIRLWEPKAGIPQALKAPAAVDTEGHKSAPWGLSVCGLDSDETLVVRTGHTDTLDLRNTIVMHNGKHDVPVLKTLGVKLPRFSFWEDTMLKGSATAEHPYNLKALAYRLLHLDMNHFDALVMPWLKKAAEAYLIELAANEWDAPPSEYYLDPKTKTWKEKNPQALHTRAWATLQRLNKGVGDPVKWLADLSDFDRIQISARDLGAVPTMWNAINYLPEDDAVQYAGLDAWATARINPILDAELVRLGRFEAYRHHQYLNDSLVEMESLGLPFDVKRCEKTDKEFGVEENKALSLVRKTGGSSSLNPRSPKQMSQVLTDLGATGRKVLISGDESTDKKTLARLRENPQSSPKLISFLDALTVFRGWTKLRSTYTSSLPKFVFDGRIYPHLSITTAISGRFSSEEPNLQNIPSRNAAGMKIRSCFRVPNEGWMLLSCDLSQIELRMAAHLSGDPVMIDAYKTGKDLHRLTMLKNFAGDPRLSDPAQEDFLRKPSKETNFSAMYGISPQALHDRFLLSGLTKFGVDACERFIKGFFGLYKGIQAEIDRCGELAKRQGFVTTLAGRARYLPLARVSEIPNAQAEAIRQAYNHEDQGSSAEVLVRGMHRWSQTEKEACNRITKTDLLLQIHDELLLQVEATGPDDPKLIAVAKRVKAMLEADSHQYKVPIIAEVKVGRSWGEMSKIKL